MKQQQHPIFTRLFVSKRFAWLHKKMFFLSLRGMGLFNYENFDISGEKFFIANVVPLAFRSSIPTIFDVGANVGDFSAMLRSAYPEATIHAFEPHPRNFEQLARREISNASLHNLAIGDVEGEMTLFDHDDNDGSKHASLHREVITDIQKSGCVEHRVSVRTLDGLAEELGIEHIDYLKIDTEGHELAVLLGAQKLLERRAIGCIHFEFNEMNIVSRSFFRDFRKALPGYEFFRMLPDGLLSLQDIPVLCELYGFQNVVAIPAEIVSKQAFARMH
jgi:FkbM family methyltransferase